MNQNTEFSKEEMQINNIYFKMFDDVKLLGKYKLKLL